MIIMKPIFFAQCVLLLPTIIHSFTLNNVGRGLLSKPTTTTQNEIKSPHLYHSNTSSSKRQSTANNINDDDDDKDSNAVSNRIDVTQDPRLYRVTIPRATGIEWGTDLSFSFVYVRDMEPSGPAFMSKVISKGDQICELCPVNEDGNAEEGVVPLIGASFDNVMTSFASLKKTVRDVELVFFKGSKDELIALCQGNDASSKGDKDDKMITITAVINKGSKDEMTKIIKTEKGSNLRQVLVDNGINVYQSFTRWTNCKGKQLCGTCIVDIKEGGMNTNRKSMDEGSTLRENPDSYRLSCVTFVYGDITVETFPPIEAAQWTR
jgi:ferredoxin